MPETGAPRAPRPPRTTAMLCAALTALLVTGGAVILTAAALGQIDAELEVAADETAHALGRTLAAQVGRAVGYGIPLDKLYDVTGYLERFVDAYPEVRRVAIRAPDGRELFATGAPATPDLSVAMVPVVDRFARVCPGGTEPGCADGRSTLATITVATRPVLAGVSVGRLGVTLLVVIVAAAGAAGVVGFAIARTAVERPRVRLIDFLRTIGAGDYRTAAPPAGTDRIGAAAEAAGRLAERVRAGYVAVRGTLRTVQAIDFDGSLTAKLQPIHDRIAAHYRFSATVGDPAATGIADGDDRASGGAWPILLGLAAWAIVQPFLPNFAVDRGSWTLPPAALPALPLAIEAGAMLVGLVFGSRLGRGRSPKTIAFGAAAALALAGVATAAVFGCREIGLFFQLRLLTGLGSGFALGLATASGIRLPGALVWLFAGLVIGPLLGGLFGELVGRRNSFLLAGIATFLIAAAIAGWWRPPGATAPRPAPPAARGAGLAGAAWPWALIGGLGIGSALFTILPDRVSFEDYLLTGCLAGLAGACALAGVAGITARAVAVRATGRATATPAVGAGLLALGIVLVAPGIAVVPPGGTAALAVAFALFGVGIGLCFGTASAAAAVRHGADPPDLGRRPAVIAGTGVGALMTFAATPLALPPGLPIAAAGVLVALVALFAARPGASREA